MKFVAILVHIGLDRRGSGDTVGGSRFGWSFETDDGYTMIGITPHAGTGGTDALVPRCELGHGNTMLTDDLAAIGAQLDKGEFVTVTYHTWLNCVRGFNSCES